MFSEARRLGLLASVPKYVVLGLILSMAWYFLRDPMWQHMPHWPTGHVYTAPEAPAANIVELAARLQRIENALSGISLDTEKGKVRAENEAKSHMELVGRLGTLESKVVAESKKAAEAEVQYRNVAREGLKVVRQEVEALQAQVHQQQQHRHQEKSDVAGGDEETRAKLKALEERVGSMESGVKEALELGKKAGNSAGTSSAWWSKLASGSASKAGLTIKSTDGQDVSGLIGHLVDSAVSLYNKDILARPDYAQHTNGAFIIPTLTSPTFELRPSTLRGHIIGVLTGAPFPIGRSPLNALHHDLHSGYCWPFAGTEGQLALSLAAPIYITDVTIDHVAREVALDIRTAPREMELWGLVEGKDNIAKVKEWMTEKAKRKEEAKERGEEVEEEEYPKTLPKSQQYIRVANFSYDIHAPNNVQTFPVLQEIRDLGVDFGIVALRVKNNWGRNDFTCLYRMRVHGERLGEKQPPYFEESA
jgi:SUN domain-containing protein 1/2